MLPFFARETVQILSASIEYDHGAPVESWDDPETVDLPGCSVQPGDSEEHLGERTDTSIVWSVYAPAGAEVSSSNRIKIRNKTYSVDGEPKYWTVGAGRVDHVLIKARRVNG